MTARAILDRIAGPLVLLAALAIAILYWQGRHVDAQSAARDRAASEHVAAVVDCQSRFNAVVVEQISTREELRRVRDLAAETVFRAIGDIIAAAQEGRDLQPEYTRFRAADAAYEKAVARLHAYKKAHPLPEFPDCEGRADLVAPHPSDSPTPKEGP